MQGFGYQNNFKLSLALVSPCCCVCTGCTGACTATELILQICCVLAETDLALTLVRRRAKLVPVSLHSSLC